MEARYVLGIDLGHASVGWAALRLDDEGKEAVGLLESGDLGHINDAGKAPSLGSRIFEEAVENYEQGEQEQTTNSTRRQKRLQRRQILRRARRQRRTFVVLQNAGLLPPSSNGKAGSDERDGILRELDLELRVKFGWGRRGTSSAAPASDPGRVPYELRRKALDELLPSHELGRAIYHLAQRRGFKSNRKEVKKQKKEEEEKSKVKKAITELDAEMKARGSRTLGEHFAKLGRNERLRRRWTARRMYEAEFEAIWTKQCELRPELAEKKVRQVLLVRRGGKIVERTERQVELKKALVEALFHQRPLKSTAHLIGWCELQNGDEYADENGVVFKTWPRRRAPKCSLEHQRFRILDKVNVLRIESNGGSRELTIDERRKLLERLENGGRNKNGELEADLTFAKVRELLGLPKKGTTFNHERTDDKLIGNRTNVKLLAVFGDRWRALDEKNKARVVGELHAIDSEEVVRQRASKQKGPWAKLRPTEAEADQLAEKVRLEDDYASHSTLAMRRLFPRMDDGEPYATVKNALYKPIPRDPMARLPPVSSLGSALRNPVVSRSLSQLRVVVNACIRRWGKPERIHVELARDIKQKKSVRAEMKKRNDDLRKKRVDAGEKVEKHGGRRESRDDIERWRLAEETDFVCAYCGKTFGASDLFQDQVEVDHIIPFSRCLDDSFMNKVVSHTDCNRRKGNRTPFEWLGGEDWLKSEFADRVRRLYPDERHRPHPKRLRLLGTDVEQFTGDFTTRHLNDTRYASLLARRYLATLFGGDFAKGYDANGKMRVQVSSGGTTAYVRMVAGLNRVLGLNGEKNRGDHRHHAVDAVAIAMTTEGLVKQLASAAERPAHERRVHDKVRLFGDFKPAWSTATDDLLAIKDAIVASHEVRHRVRGALHEETFYSTARDEEGRELKRGLAGEWLTWKGQPYKGKVVVHVRKAVDKLEAKQVATIVDDRIRSAVEDALKAAGQTDPSKAFGKKRDDKEVWPQLTAKDGSKVDIRRVRVRKSGDKFFGVGRDRTRGQVESDANHHMAIFEEPARRGTKWSCRIVSLIEAAGTLRDQRRHRDELLKSGVPGADARRRAELEHPLIRKSLEGKPQASFVMALSPGEIVTMNDRQGVRSLYRLRGVSRINGGTLQLSRINDAREKKQMEYGDAFDQIVLNTFRDRDPRLVVVTPLGELRRVGRNRPCIADQDTPSSAA